MNKSTFPLFLILMAITGCHISHDKDEFNLDFEKTIGTAPKGWGNDGSSGYSFLIDSTLAQSGKKCAVIEFRGGEPGYKTCSYTIPEKYQGKKITLTGYVRTENVTDGWAGIWMHTEPSGEYAHMNDSAVTGTTGWKKYEISLDLHPIRSKQIIVGGILVGRGKVWIDNLELTVDGKPLDKAPLKKVLPAEKDKEFDKGSHIDHIRLNEASVDNLYTFGLVWGFLKYYHPAVAAGKYNWDYELFRILPKILKAENSQQRDEVLYNWIKALGPVQSASKDSSRVASVKFNPDLEWIEKSNFPRELQGQLSSIKNALRGNDNYYVGLFPGVGNADFSCENSYYDMNFTDAGFRMLSLYRYWNIIQYYYPYKNLIEEDWKAVLKEFIPKFVNASDRKEYTLDVLELIARIHDTHANIWGNDDTLEKFRGWYDTPVEVKFIENKAIVTRCFNEDVLGKSSLQPGDVIVSINGKLVDEVVKERMKYTPASNYPTQLRNIARDLLRTSDSVIRVQYQRNKDITSAELKTFPEERISAFKYKDTHNSYFNFVKPDIGYIYMGLVTNAALPKIMKDVKNTKGLIIDIRCYPSDFAVFSLSEYLLPRSVDFTRFSYGSISRPGLFSLTTPPLQVGHSNPDYYKGKVVILVNEETQSMAEYTTMALRTAPRATVIGSTTAGADGNVSEFYLPGNIKTMISGIGVYYPDGRETQRIGIVPDIESRPTIAGIKQHRDEVLEKAIEVIYKK